MMKMGALKLIIGHNAKIKLLLPHSDHFLVKVKRTDLIDKDQPALRE